MRIHTERAMLRSPVIAYALQQLSSDPVEIWPHYPVRASGFRLFAAYIFHGRLPEFSPCTHDPMDEGWDPFSWKGPKDLNKVYARVNSHVLDLLDCWVIGEDLMVSGLQTQAFQHFSKINQRYDALILLRWRPSIPNLKTPKLQGLRVYALDQWAERFAQERPFTQRELKQLKDLDVPLLKEILGRIYHREMNMAAQKETPHSYEPLQNSSIGNEISGSIRFMNWWQQEYKQDWAYDVVEKPKRESEPHLF
jgi:hypothetical protein